MVVPEIEAVNEGHFEKEVVEWMTKEDKLQTAGHGILSSP